MLKKATKMEGRRRMRPTATSFGAARLSSAAYGAGRKQGAGRQIRRSFDAVVGQPGRIVAGLRPEPNSGADHT